MDAWLRTLPKGTLDKWLVFDSIEPIGEQRLQTAEITALLYRLTAHSLASFGREMTPIKTDAYMPPRYRPEVVVKKAKPVKPEDQFKQVAATLGLGRIVEKHGRDNKPS